MIVLACVLVGTHANTMSAESAAAPITAQDVLATMLEEAEAKGLPEGVYLEVANGLKVAHREMSSVRRAPGRWMQMNVGVHIKVMDSDPAGKPPVANIHITRLIYRDSVYNGKYEMEIKNADGAVIKTHKLDKDAMRRMFMVVLAQYRATQINYKVPLVSGEEEFAYSFQGFIEDQRHWNRSMTDGDDDSVDEASYATYRSECGDLIFLEIAAGVIAMQSQDVLNHARPLET